MIVILPDKSELRGLLAQKLLDDPSGKVLAAYLECFEQALVEAKARMLGPLPLTEYEVNTAVTESASLSMEVVQAVWQALHS